MNGLTENLVNFLVEAERKDFPKSTIEAAKMAILDVVGCCIGACNTDVGLIARRALVELGNKKEATILGTGEQTSCINAAFVNATLAMVLDLDDIYEANSLIISHPGQSVIPAALAVGEKIGASGRDILTAIILGYEVDVRIGKAVEPRKDDIYSFGTHQCIGACVATSKILKLDKAKMMHAIGIAGAHAPVPSTRAMWCFKTEERPASWTRDTGGGDALVGVLSSFLALNGFKACPRLLDKKTGFWMLLGSDHYDEEIITKDLGKGYAIEGTTYKIYPSCRFNQFALEGVREIVEKNHLGADEIETIKVRAAPTLTEMFCFYPPLTSIDTASSLPYLVAMLLVSKNPKTDTAHWYKNYGEWLQTEEVRKVAEKVRITGDEELGEILKNERKPLSIVEIIAKNGKLFEACVEYPIGHPKNPLSQEELIDKFQSLTIPKVGEEKANLIVSTIKRLEKVTSISDEIKNWSNDGLAR